MINIYVAGKLKKRKLKQIYNINYLCPYEHANNLSIYDSNIYVTIDLVMINKCDLILLVLETGKELNSLFELGYCYALNKPIITLDLLKDSSLYTFTKHLSTSIVKTYKELYEILERL